MRAFGFWGVPFQGYCPDSSLCRPQRAREKVVLPALLRPQSRIRNSFVRGSRCSGFIG